jgi:signal transduction histidine kinase
MDISRRSTLIYGLLLFVWVLVVAWQVEEHMRIENAARAELIYRAKDISTTVSIVLRSQRRFGAMVFKDRLESALTDLVRPGEISGIALLNASGDVVASAGSLTNFQGGDTARAAELWEGNTVTLMNLVDLGTNITRDIENTNAAIVMSREDFSRPPDTNPIGSDTNRAGADRFDGGPPPGPPPSAVTTNEEGQVVANRRPRGRFFGRPPWMSEVDYREISEKRGVHSFLISLSTEPVQAVARQDLWLRFVIAFFAGISAAGFGLAWRAVARTSELQIRLVRASEINTHLKEMNLAAAGLAHETRNPLNIIRGIAQMLSRQSDATAEVREKSRAIVDETDKVTAQLNEFINYSRPREIRRAVLPLHPAIKEVVRALNYDIDEKKVKLEIKGEPLSVEADEQLFRQTLFNLLLNAVQALPTGGEISVVTGKQSASEAFLEVRDNGPGVPPERRKEIFKPYFTTHQKGTGLGLAVVQQIVLAHGWEIECLANEPQGAVFRITHLKVTT